MTVALTDRARPPMGLYVQHDGLRAGVGQDRGMDLDRDAGAVAISLPVLRAALAEVIDAIEDVHGPVVRVHSDRYWTLFVREQFAFSDAPPVPTVGQLTDDFESVGEVMANGGQEPVWHLLQHVMGLLAGAGSATLDRLVDIEPMDAGEAL